MFDRAELARLVAKHGRVARVVIVETRGSVPRETGTAMCVWHGGQSGTIGGGALEFAAAEAARAGGDELRLIPLGPALGQCCGGAVRLLTEIYDAGRVAELPETGLICRALNGEPQGPRPGQPGLQGGWFAEDIAPARRDLWVWGAGHVGRAVVNVLAPLPDFAITWADTDMARYPAEMPAGVTPLPAADLERLAAHCPQTAEHLILTYSHEIDLALCHALLTRGFAGCGVIGSATKWARFQKRLVSLGHAHAEISRICCPIGDPRLGKHPQAIAVGVAAALINSSNEQEYSRDGAHWGQHSYHSQG